VNDLIQRLVEAIFRQEGMGPTHSNPGNLRAAPWLAKPTIVKGFWHPASRAEGVAGAAHVVALHIARGDSLAQLIEVWAPPSENNTAQYITNVAKWAQISDPHIQLYKLLGVEQH